MPARPLPPPYPPLRIAPTAAQRANQIDRRYRLRARQMARLQLRSQHLPFTIDHIQIADRALRVLRARQMRRPLRGLTASFCSRI